MEESREWAMGTIPLSECHLFESPQLTLLCNRASLVFYIHDNIELTEPLKGKILWTINAVTWFGLKEMWGANCSAEVSNFLSGMLFKNKHWKE